MKSMVRMDHKARWQSYYEDALDMALKDGLTPEAAEKWASEQADEEAAEWIAGYGDYLMEMKRDRECPNV